MSLQNDLKVAQLQHLDTFDDLKKAKERMKSEAGYDILFIV